jgi:hypothetical protein
VRERRGATEKSESRHATAGESVPHRRWGLGRGTMRFGGGHGSLRWRHWVGKDLAATRIALRCGVSAMDPPFVVARAQLGTELGNNTLMPFA